MIAGIFHEGSGLGDQLFRYITVRTLAEEKGYEWGMSHLENFKGDSFINLQTGQEIMPDGTIKVLLDSQGKPRTYQGEIAYFKKVPFRIFEERIIQNENGIDIRSYDPEINFVEDNTIIDGSFEDSKYWHSNLDNISNWLDVEPLNIPDDLCVIGFRGGEYASNPDLFLPPSYYTNAMFYMTDNGIELFQVHTDDPALAKKYLPDIQIIDNQPISHSKHTNMGFNWRSARYAKYAIIPNSAFFILPRLLKHHEDPEAITIAPRYWARHNTKVWARPACYYEEFTYI